MRVIHLKDPERSAAVQQSAWQGTALTLRDVDTILREDADVYKPDGSILLHFRKAVIPDEVCQRAYSVLRTVKGDPSNRAIAALGFSRRSSRKDGSLSKQTRIRMARYPQLRNVGSAVIGNIDRTSSTAWFPYCRQTAFNLEHPGLFAECMDYIQLTDKHFKAIAPERHAAQAAVVARTHPEWVIHGTAFTTITVNRNFRTRGHRDVGDLKEGFGVMSALPAGLYTGGYNAFPEFRVAVDMRQGDVLLGDVHEWHGNTTIHGVNGEYERVSCVFYYRERMLKCGTPAEELERAKIIGLNAKLKTPEEAYVSA